MPEFKELVDEGCGMILTIHQPKALADTIEQVLDDSYLASQLEKRNIEFAQTRTWDIIALHFCKLYNHILVN